MIVTTVAYTINMFHASSSVAFVQARSIKRVRKRVPKGVHRGVPKGVPKELHMVVTKGVPKEVSNEYPVMPN
jgi:hypothetical protein